MSYTIFNKCKIDKSRVSKCYAMSTNLRLKNPSCRAYIFKRLLSYVFNQINNFIMVLIEKTKIRDSETSRPKIRESETQRNTRKFPETLISGYHSPPVLSHPRIALIKKPENSRNRYRLKGHSNDLFWVFFSSG